MSAYVIDTETTGMEPPEVIELAYAKLGSPETWPARSTYELPSYRFKPEKGMAFGALAVHNILPSELENEPPSVLAKAQLPTDMEYVIGHGIDYDADALGIPLQVKRICTLAMSRETFPKTDSHKLGAMYYFINQANLAGARLCVSGAHGAIIDVKMCLDLFVWLCSYNQIPDLEAAYAFSEEARIPKIWSFGKHKGNPVAGTDRGYLSWCLKQPDMDQYVKLACTRALSR